MTNQYYSAEHDALTRTIATEELGQGAREAVVFYQMIRQECGGFDLRIIRGEIVSPAGAQGIAQIIPRWHPTVDPLDPPAALRYAARWFKGLLQQYEGNPRAAAAAYNAGPARVNEWMRLHGLAWELSVYAETAAYLRIVMEGALLRVPLGEDQGLVTPWAQAVITQEFGWSQFARDGGYPDGKGGYNPHHGIDFGEPGGVPYGRLCAAVLPGTVIFRGVKPESPGRGIQVIATIDGQPGATQAYFHLAGTTVMVDNRLERGSVLGYVGSTGYSTAPHTHLQIERAGQAVDPAELIFAGDGQPPPQPPLDPAAPLHARIRTLQDGLTVYAVQMEADANAVLQTAQRESAELMVRAGDIRRLVHGDTAAIPAPFRAATPGPDSPPEEQRMQRPDPKPTPDHLYAKAQTLPPMVEALKRSAFHGLYFAAAFGLYGLNMGGNLTGDLLRACLIGFFTGFIGRSAEGVYDQRQVPQVGPDTSVGQLFEIERERMRVA